MLYAVSSITQYTTTYDVRVLLGFGQSESSKGLNYTDGILHHSTYHLNSGYVPVFCLTHMHDYLSEFW